MIPKSACLITLKTRQKTSENHYHQHAQPGKKRQTQILADVNVVLYAKSLFPASIPARLCQCRARCRVLCKKLKVQHCSLSSLFLRRPQALAQSVTDSSFVELGANERGRCSTVAVSAAAADLWRDVWAYFDAGAWATTFPPVKSKRTSLFEVVHPGLISAGHDFADGARLWYFLISPRLWFWQRRERFGRHPHGALDCTCSQWSASSLSSACCDLGRSRYRRFPLRSATWSRVC